MMKSENNKALFITLEKVGWQQKLKEQFGQLTLSDVKFEVGKEHDLLNRIGIRLNKTLPEVMNIFKKLKPF